ncbi:MAG: hypothetical protein L0229_30460 [Blastocatellia bacterium]|nr:hypothetical protein [Blastocatellia bacterium]
MKKIVASLFLMLAFVVANSAAPTPGKTIDRDSTAKGPALPAAPSAVVAVYLQSPDFTVRELKYRVFYNKGEVKRIPLTDYDFKAAFTDELMNALAEEKRLEWREQSADETIDVVGLYNRKVSMPQIQADRLLLVNIQEYGAFLASLAADKFYIMARFKLIDRASGKKLWEKKLYERIDLDGKIADMQADNQKGLKEGINKVLEKVCAKIVAEMRKSKL